MSQSIEPVPYFSISTIAVKPDKVAEASPLLFIHLYIPNPIQVYACFAEIAKETEEKEPGAKMYRFYKTEGKNEFVWIEKFESKEAYTAHVQSEHVQKWAAKYINDELFDGTFEFHPPSTTGQGTGGFDRL